MHYAAAIDLGATSGRVIVGAWDGEALKLTEVHRFPNAFHTLAGYDYWDMGGFVDNIREGLHKAREKFPMLKSCGVDTWGVDHVIVDAKGRMVFPPHAYRDERTLPFLKNIKDTPNEEKLFNWSGLPLINYNSSLQLAETVSSYPGLEEIARHVLLLPDYFNFILSGKQVNEISIASTTQLLDIHGDDFSPEALDYFRIPAEWFRKPTQAGEILGPVKEKGLEDVQVVLVPGHDTSCAYEATPRIGKDLFVSAGTWLLVGAITEKPLLGKAALEFGVSNERTGYGGYRPNKSMLGLWLLEQSAIHFNDRPKSGKEWDDLAEQAAELSAPEVLIDLNDDTLYNPVNMCEQIEAQITATGGKVPTTLPEYMRLICDSLGKGLADAAKTFEQLSGETFDNIIIVGGGSKNSLLCQKAADYSGLTVTSFNLEGTAVGNIGYQLKAMGAIDSFDTYRAAIAKGINSVSYNPKA